MSIESSFNRTWLPSDDTFVSFGSGADIDMAFDDAALSDRFDYGTSGLLASLADVDPTVVQVAADAVMHRHLAWRWAISEAAKLEPGSVLALPTAPFKAYKHRAVAVTVTDPSIPAPLEPTGLWNHDELFTAAVDLCELAEGEQAVSAQLPRMGSVRYKAAASVVPGPKVTSFAVHAKGASEPLSVHPTMPLARKAALLLARDKQNGPLELEVRPVVTKADGAPLVSVTRHVVACKRPVKVLLASVKNPDKELAVDGWLFVGRR